MPWLVQMMLLERSLRCARDKAAMDPLGDVFMGTLRPGLGEEEPAAYVQPSA